MKTDFRRAAALVRGLPPRLRAVLRGLTRGLERKEIASELNISRRTVDCHCDRLYRRLKLNNAREAVRVGLLAKS